jgi:uncharacterized OB-fold protein
VSTEATARPARPLPAVDDDNRHFWTGGADGELRILRCGDCGHYIHPPRPLCPRCLSPTVAPAAVSGRGTVDTFTVNYRAWNPEVPPPYVIARVELDEQDELYLVTNIVGCPVDDVRIGMRVGVQFEQVDDVYLPLFTPLEQS